MTEVRFASGATQPCIIVFGSILAKDIRDTCAVKPVSRGRRNDHYGVGDVILELNACKLDVCRAGATRLGNGWGSKVFYFPRIDYSLIE
jgi:hypothetical protein